VVTVFLATFISGTLLNQLQQVLERPASLLAVLGVGAPQTASFFLLYVLFVALVAVPLRLLQPWGLAVYLVGGPGGGEGEGPRGGGDISLSPAAHPSLCSSRRWLLAALAALASIAL
jgi:hypothetical protein